MVVGDGTIAVGPSLLGIVVVGVGASVVCVDAISVEASVVGTSEGNASEVRATIVDDGTAAVGATVVGNNASVVVVVSLVGASVVVIGVAANYGKIAFHTIEEILTWNTILLYTDQTLTCTFYKNFS